MTDFNKPLVERVRVGAPPAGFTDDDWGVVFTAAHDPEGDGACVPRDADLARRMRAVDPLPPFVTRGEWDALTEIVSAGREPSMTEILASIRRIQEEDDGGAIPDDKILKMPDGSPLIIAGEPCRVFESPIPMDAILGSIKDRLKERRGADQRPGPTSADDDGSTRVLDQDEIDSLLGLDRIPASPAPGEGVKDDAGKLEWSQIPPDAMAEIIKRYMLGAEKYGRGNWARGMAWSRIFDAMMRHAWAFWGGERDDPQDPGHHLAAAAWCAITLLTYDLRGLGTDDRGSPVVKVAP